MLRSRLDNKLMKYDYHNLCWKSEFIILFTYGQSEWNRNSMPNTGIHKNWSFFVCDWKRYNDSTQMP